MTEPQPALAPTELERDLRRMARRLALTRMLGASAAALGLPGLARAGDAAAVGACIALPEETAGPYPANGGGPTSNAANVLASSGVVRSDLRSSFGGAGGTAQGVPLQLTIKLVDVSAGCAPLPGRAVYLWHCTRDGGYSLYTRELRDENFLRGVQVSDAHGQISFQTIFPGCYPGRYPHLHLEVYPTADGAPRYDRKYLTSQLALPQDACGAVYGETRGYESSLQAYARISLEKDGIFSDNSPAEIAAQTVVMKGSPGHGYVGRAIVGMLG
ncbi:intradiol ring-cleavage dioxygenase [Pigmentiphaga sp. D-2]|uniref:dioxygenase family protein n=1 Tax=Pigmentiphaga sp. D-2 TaxID=1002116 RepID=UPI001A9ED4DC|nr:intradiol ring-cleavage dioxygenase [Pigmentiphaga sp. D-2]